MTFRITGFSDFVHRPVFWQLENTAFDLFPSSAEGETPTLLGLALSKGPNRVGVPTFTWGRKHIGFPKRYVFYFLEHRTMDKVRKHSNSELLSCLSAFWFNPEYDTKFYSS
jgi:hypothetical protein